MNGKNERSIVIDIKGSMFNENNGYPTAQATIVCDRIVMDAGYRPVKAGEDHKICYILRLNGKHVGSVQKSEIIRISHLNEKTDGYKVIEVLKNKRNKEAATLLNDIHSMLDVTVSPLFRLQYTYIKYVLSIVWGYLGLTSLLMGIDPGMINRDRCRIHIITPEGIINDESR